MVSLKDLLGFLNLKLELEGPAEEAPEVMRSPVETDGWAAALHR